MRVESLPKAILSDAAKTSETLWVQIRVQDHDDGRERCHQRVQIVASRPHFGGTRWWFVCPQTGARCRILYLVKGSDQLLSRYELNASYDSQHKRKFERALMRARRLRMRLGGEASLLASTPSKPKWMRWKTYHEVVHRLLEAEGLAFRGLDEHYRASSLHEETL